MMEQVVWLFIMASIYFYPRKPFIGILTGIIACGIFIGLSIEPLNHTAVVVNCILLITHLYNMGDWSRSRYYDQ